MAVSQFIPLKSLTYILASHQDPDIIGAVDRWLMYTDAKGGLLHDVGPLAAAQRAALPAGFQQ